MQLRPLFADISRLGRTVLWDSSSWRERSWHRAAPRERSPITRVPPGRCPHRLRVPR